MSVLGEILREAVLTYKTAVEFEDNVVFTASGGYTVQLPDNRPEDANDVLLGHTLTIHPDSDDVGSVFPYPTSDLNVNTQAFNSANGDQYVVWSASSASGSPGTFFLHATLTAVYAKTA